MGSECGAGEEGHGEVSDKGWELRLGCTPRAANPGPACSLLHQRVAKCARGAPAALQSRHGFRQNHDSRGNASPCLINIGILVGWR